MKNLQEILVKLQESPFSQKLIRKGFTYITVKEFMAALRMCRSNFDKLVKARKITTLKKVERHR